jgi:hypothetical protein
MDLSLGMARTRRFPTFESACPLHSTSPGTKEDWTMLRSRAALLPLAIFALLGFATTAAWAQVGPPGGTIYAHDVAYRTVATPKDLPPHGKFDTIYVLGGSLASVAESAPGDQDFNGGRWEVRLVTFVTIAPTQFTNAEEVEAAAQSGQIQISGVVRRFECPLIRKH